MVKKGPLSKVEIFYIDNNIHDIAVEKLAEDLNRSIKTVETYIKKLKKTTAKTKINTTRITAGDHFIKQNGSVIMTENASTISDSKRKAPSSNSNKKFVTKIKE